MRVDRLIILYRANVPNGEAQRSARALEARFRERVTPAVRERVARGLRDRELAQAKLDKGLDTHCHVIGFSGMTNAQQRKETVKRGIKKMDMDVSSLGKLWGQENGDDKERTWGVYVLIHGSSGIASHGEPEQLAEMIRKIGERRKKWRLKKVCIVACTLGAEGITHGGMAEPFVKQCCDALKWPDALVGGYTVPVYVGFADHPSSHLPDLALEANAGHKLVAPTRDGAQFPYDVVENTVVRLSDHNRANYKVAWRWDGTASVPVDIANEWYHR